MTLEANHKNEFNKKTDILLFQHVQHYKGKWLRKREKIVQKQML